MNGSLQLGLLLLLTFSLPSSSAASEKKSRQIDQQDCYHLFSPGRRLIEPSVSATFAALSSEECLQRCDEENQFECIAYSFGYSQSNSEGGICDLLAYAPKLAFRSTWTTIASPRFNIYERDRSCDDLNSLNLQSEQPRARILTGKIRGEQPSFVGFAGDSYYQVQPVQVYSPRPAAAKKKRPPLLHSTNNPFALTKPAHNQKIEDFSLPLLLRGQACYKQIYIGRRLSANITVKSWTAYSVEECKQFCTAEITFRCVGFAYRDLLGPQETLNCDLSDKNDLDPYNSEHFHVDALTDFYRRLSNCKEDEDEKIPQSVGNDVIHHYSSSSFQHRQQNSTQADLKCYERIRTGYKHFTYRNSLPVSSLEDCVTECRKAGNCKTFSFKYRPFREPVTAVGKTMNCLLSDTATLLLKESDFDRSAGGDWDIFELSSSNTNCLSNNNGGGSGGGYIGPLENEDCHIKRRDGYKHYTSIEALSVLSVSDCSQRCHERSQYCRSFSFRYNDESFLYISGPYNCLLSSEISNRPQDIELNAPWSMYEIINTGSSECGSSRFGNDEIGPYTGYSEGDCYTREKSGYKFVSFLVRDLFAANDVESCSRQCARTSACRSFAFRRNAYVDNCQVSNVDLLSYSSSNSDLLPDFKWDAYSQKLSSACLSGSNFYQDSTGTFGDCHKLSKSGYRFIDVVARDEISVRDLNECAQKCVREQYCKSFAFKSSGFYQSSSANCQLASLSISSISSSDLNNADIGWNVYERLFSSQCNGGSSSNGGGGTVNPSGCPNYKLDQTGYKLYYVIIRDIEAKSLLDCTEACKRDPSCRTFAFRNLTNLYSPTATTNCQLTNIPATNLLSQDLVADSAWNIFELPLGANCQSGPESGNCYRRERSGYRHYSSSSRTSVSNIEECSDRCRRLSICRSFSFKYLTSSSENCLLSPTDGRDLNDLVVDSNWDVYQQICQSSGGGGGQLGGQDGCSERIRDNYRHRTFLVRDTRNAYNLAACAAHCRRSLLCSSFSYTSGDDYDNCLLSDEQFTSIDTINDLDYDLSWNVYRLSINSGNCPADNYSDDCYRAVERDYNLDQRVVRDTIRVTGLVKCEEACTDTRLFKCLTFAFSSSLNSRYNCYLSDRAYANLQLSLDMVRDFDSIIYELTPNCNRNIGRAEFIGASGCFVKHRVDYRLDYSTADEVTDATSKEDCERQCVASYSFDCKGFAYRFMSNPFHNCELTRKDVRTIGQYELDHALGWTLYQKTAGSCIASSNGYRSEEDNDDVGLARYDRYKFDYKIVPRAVVVRKSVLDATHCAKECDFHRSTSTRGCQAFSYSSTAQFDNCQMTDISGRNLVFYLQTNVDFNTYLLSGLSMAKPTLEKRIYSVSGRPCFSGRVMDTKARYWYCQTDTHDWDYCCRPGSTCGYSQGYDFAWCFVGETGFDQWRPCEVMSRYSNEASISDFMESREGRELINKEGQQLHPVMENRAPDPLHAEFLRDLRNSRTKDINLVRFDAQDVIPLIAATNQTSSSTSSSSIVKFGLT